MNTKKLFVTAFVATVGLATLIGSFAIAEPAKNTVSAGPAEMKLPPGWTLDDMQACMLAGTPGEMQHKLAEGVGKWQGETTMWMAPDTDPMTTDCTSTVSTIMDGRFVQVEMESEIPGMGPYNGLGIYGFDNVSQKLVATWIDNHSTGIMNGEGKMSRDGKTTTWTYTHNCPITKKPTVLREVDTMTGSNTMTLEMFGNDPKSGKEFKMMSIKLKRT